MTGQDFCHLLSATNFSKALNLPRSPSPSAGAVDPSDAALTGASCEGRWPPITECVAVTLSILTHPYPTALYAIKARSVTVGSSFTSLPSGPCRPVLESVLYRRRSRRRQRESNPPPINRSSYDRLTVYG